MQQGTDQPPEPESPTVLEGSAGHLRPAPIGVTVVVPSFNSAAHIGACIASVRRCLPNAEVIVVENGSTDETVEAVRNVSPEVVIVSGQGNVGFGRACNLGAERASNPYVLYLNPDAELVSVDPGALAAAAGGGPFGMVAAMLVEGEGPPRSTVRRQTGHWLSEFVAVHLLAMLSTIAPRPRYVERAEGRGTFTVGGAVALVAVEELNSAGGFDERFFMYYEDTDLTQRYLQLGYPVRSSPALLARHVGGASAPAPRRNALSFLGWLEYVSKWHGSVAAQRGATIARVTYALVLSALRLLTQLTGNARVGAKTDQVSAMMSEIAAGAEDVGAADRCVRYPSAGPIGMRTFRSFAPDRSEHK